MDVHVLWLFILEIRIDCGRMITLVIFWKVLVYEVVGLPNFFIKVVIDVVPVKVLVGGTVDPTVLRSSVTTDFSKHIHH